MNRHSLALRSLGAVKRSYGLIAVLMLEAFIFLGGQNAKAQQNSYLNSIGTPAFSLNTPIENGNINLANGNLHLEIPIGSALPQRGLPSFRSVLMYDSAIWYGWRSVNTSLWWPRGGGWRLVTSADPGTTDNSRTDRTCYSDIRGETVSYEVDFDNFSWTAPDGTQHVFPIHLSVARDPDPTSCPAGITKAQDDAFATDGSGYHMWATTNGDQIGTVNVLAPDGTTNALDTNGNYYGQDTSYNVRLAHTNPIDTLGRKPILLSSSGNTDYIDVLTSTGTRQRYVIVWQTINVSTSFGDFTTEYSGTLSVIQEIDLPDGSKYKFEYEQGTTPGNFGLLTGMTLPTGGHISYSYMTFADAYNQKYRWVKDRTTSGTGITGGIWYFSPEVIGTCPGYGANCQQKATLTAPSGDATVYTFSFNGGPWANKIESYNGSASSGTLLSTISRTYDFGQNCTPNVDCNIPGTTYVVKLNETTTIPIPGGSINRAKQVVWDGSHNGNVTQASEWNFYGASKPGNADRTTCYTYLAGTDYAAANIINRPHSITVVDNWSADPCSSPPTAHIVSQTIFSYDGPVSPATDIAQHDDQHFGTDRIARGNVTQIQSLVNGATYLSNWKTYDTTGQVTTSTDANGNQTSYDYTDNFYDDPGNDSSPTPHAGEKATNAYLKTVTQAKVGSLSLTSTYGYYWGSGKLAITADPNGSQSSFHYADPFDRPTGSSLPGSGWTRHTYAPSGLQADEYIGTTNTAASTTCTTCRHNESILDAFGRETGRVLVSDPSGATMVSTFYDSSGRVQSVSTPYRTVSDPTYGLDKMTYDGLGRTTKVQHGDTDYVSSYSGAEVSSGSGNTTQLCSSSTYGIGYPVLTKDEIGNKRQQWIDGFGRVIEVDEPNASGALTANTCYKYDLNNNLVQVAGQNGQIRGYSYDLLSRITGVSTPESGSTTYFYTTAGGALCSGDPHAICLRLDQRSILTTYSYDALNRLISVAYSDSTPAVWYGYDGVTANGCVPPFLIIATGLGRRTGMCDGTGETAWSYDAAGNVATQVRRLNGITKTISYTYNPDGSLATMTYPGSRFLSYTENNAQRVTGIQDRCNGVSYITNATYAPQGALASIQNDTNLVSNLLYNNRLQLCRLSVRTSGAGPASCTDSANTGNVMDLAYSYAQNGHNNGSIATQTNNVVTGKSQVYTYDPLDRLLTAKSLATSGIDCWGQSFGSNATPPTLAADTSGNMFYTTTTQCSSPEPRFGVDSNNHFTGAITYDLAGNMTFDGVYSYIYDAENRLLSASGMQGGPYCYGYDGDGLRVVKAHASGGSCTANRLVDTLYWRAVDGNAIAETDGSGSTTNANYHEYIFLGDRRIARSDVSTGGIYFYFADHLGNTRTMTGRDGTACFKMEYYPYGQEQPNSTTACNTNYKFAGYEVDGETALDYAFARHYNPRLGRFMSGDLIAGDVANPQTLNRYAYGLDNPINVIDPKGMKAVSDEIDWRAWGFHDASSDSQIPDLTLTPGQRQRGRFSSGFAEEVSRALQEHLDDIANSDRPTDSELWVQAGVDHPGCLVNVRTDATWCPHSSATVLVAANNGHICGDFICDSNNKQVGIAPPEIRGLRDTSGGFLLVVGAVRGGRFVAANARFDGPSPGLAYGNGRVFGVRWGSFTIFRLDYQPTPTSGGIPKLHIHLFEIPFGH